MAGKRTHRSAEEELLIKEAGFDPSIGMRSVPNVPNNHVPGIYFAAAVGANLIKIGTLVDNSKVQRRLDVLQPGCPYQLQHLFTLAPANRLDGARLHKVFEEYSVRNGWFKCKGRLKGYLQYAAFDPEGARCRMLSQLLY